MSSRKYEKIISRLEREAGKSNKAVESFDRTVNLKQETLKYLYGFLENVTTKEEFMAYMKQLHYGVKEVEETLRTYRVKR